MNAWDILLLLCIAAAAVLALRKCVRDWRHGKTACGTCGGCGGCAHCGGCPAERRGGGHG